MRLSELKLYLKKGSKKQKALFNTLLRQNKYLDINIPEDSIKKLFPGLYSSENDIIVYTDPHPRKRRRRTVSRRTSSAGPGLDQNDQTKAKADNAAENTRIFRNDVGPKIRKDVGPKRRKIERAEQQIVLPSTHMTGEAVGQSSRTT